MKEIDETDLVSSSKKMMNRATNAVISKVNTTSQKVVEKVADEIQDEI